MRVTLAILSLLLFGQMGCSDDAVESAPTTGDKIPSSYDDDPSITTLNGTWKVYSFENVTTHITEYKTHENSNGNDIIVEFNDTQDPHGFSGINTTNTFGGEFVYAGSRQFKLKRVITTLVGQPEWGNKFDKLVQYGHYRDVTFEINAEMLRMYYDYRTKSVTLIKQ